MRLCLLLLTVTVSACAAHTADPVRPPVLEVVADSVYAVEDVGIPPRMLNRSEVNREMSERFQQLPVGSRIGATIRHRLLVDETGVVLEIRLVESSGRTDLDEAVAASLHVARFEPGSDEGRAVQVWTEHTMRIDFRVIPI